MQSLCVASRPIINVKKVSKLVWVNTQDIIIPQRFIDAGVREEKIQERTAYYFKHGKMDSPIQLKWNNVCFDGYSRLVCAIWLDLEKVLCEYVK